jgi:AraC-like DNA-binding protein
MGAGLFWAFATELFGDRPRVELARFAPAALLLAIGVAKVLTDGTLADGFFLAHNFIGAALMIHVLVVIWSGWRNDLVESRRRLRGPILAAAALYAVAVIAVQISEIFWGSAQALSPLAAAVLLILGLAGIGALLQADPDLFARATAPRPTMPLPEPVPTTSGEDTKITQKLDRLMREERVYREEALTITALALKLGIPEYKLRRLINQQLGYRNFNAFLNQWRLADARQALADPAQRDVPISTIALDAGFQSLGPFNRAFKSESGLTPTAFRAEALAAQTEKPAV